MSATTTLAADRAAPGPDRRALSDGFRRTITYLRVSVTDRCDLRCRYCMAEEMRFLPRNEVMALEEIDAIVSRFIARGVRKVRLTGGEPLVRRGVPELARSIGRHLGGGGLDELTLTTNGTHLGKHAVHLADAGVRRINVSLDTLDPDRFRRITRWGELDRTLGGIRAARAAGLRIKINMVAMRGVNEDEIADMLDWCGREGHDLTLIETMPLGSVADTRSEHYLALGTVLERLEARFTLAPVDHSTGGPARYFDVAGSGGRLGIITPMSHNFCESCNRVRLTVEGKLYLCLGHDDHTDLRSAYREGGVDGLDAAIDTALVVKPLRHLFQIAATGDVGPARHMSATGG
jgi:GTP 3',8-cyclase